MVPRILLWIGMRDKNERKVEKPQARGKFERWGSDPNAGAGLFSGPSIGDKDRRRAGLGQEEKRAQRLECGRSFAPWR